MERHAVAADVTRITLPLPTGPKHVHCYVIDGTLFDTGIGLGEPHWDELGIERIAITHFHPDHVGGAEAAAEDGDSHRPTPHAEPGQIADQLELRAIPKEKGAEVLAAIAVQPDQLVHEAAVRGHRAKGGHRSRNAPPNPFGKP